MAGDLIGRDEELSVVQAFLDREVEGLRALVLEGEAGIGKSTLWLAGVAAARERSFQVLASRPAEAERTLANVVLGDLFGDAEPEALAALPAPRRRAFEAALLREGSELPVDARALGVAIVTLLPTLSEGSPLVLAIDDDQWMDPSSAATLGFALRRSLRQPVLLLLSRRIDGVSVATLEEALNPAEVERLRLGPLSAGAIQSLLRQRLGIALPRPTLLRLHELSGGNPFYALELARASSMDPAHDPTVPLAVPRSLDRLVTARVETLDAPTREALLLIAAHGRLPVMLLRALEVAPDALEPARAANVIETSDGVIRFTHPLLAAALYQGAAGEERRSAHRRLARVFDDPIDRGRHLALGTNESDDELAMALESASSTARERGMAMAAAELAEHALRLTPPDADDHWHRRAMATARAHVEAGEAGRARAIAADLLARAPRGARRAEALVVTADLEGPRSAAVYLGDALAEAAGIPELQAAIHVGLAGVLRATKGRAAGERHARESLRLAERLNNDALRAHALSMLAHLRFERGDPRALELGERAYHLVARITDSDELKFAVRAVGWMLTWSGNNHRAREWLEPQLDNWRDRDEEMRLSLVWDLALVELWSGHWSLASEYADQALEIGIQYGESAPDHFPSALIALHRGQFVSARDHSRRALSLAKEHVLPTFHAILGICDLWSGSPEDALANLVQAEEAADARGWDESNLRGLRAEHVEALLQLGRIDDAERLVADWEAAAVRARRDWVLAQVVRCRGLIAAARGDLPAALDLLEKAVDRHQEVGDPFGRARALLALGVVRRRARQKRTARVALEEALVGFNALGAVSWAAVARAELARIGGRERIEGLSPSELRVASLVAEGHTNREIASALFLGERTVAGHLTRIYAKLGVRSRTELARQLPHPTPPLSAAGDKVERF